MIEQELKNVWRASSVNEHIRLDTTKLLTELKKKMEHIDIKIKRRDQREIIASYIGMVGFTIMALYIPFPMTKIACVLCVLWFGYVIYRLKSLRKYGQPDLSLPLTEQLEQRKHYLKKQAHLLDSVLYWYIIPPFIINALFLFGLGDPSTWDSAFASILPDTLKSKVIGLVITGLLFAYITWMNRKAARTVYPPLIKSIEKLQSELKKE